MARKRQLVNRYAFRDTQVVFGESENREGVFENGVFKPVFHQDVYVDQNCRFYRGSYVERQLVISQGVIRTMIDAGAFFGYFRENEFRIDRESLLEFLNKHHYTQRTSEAQTVALIPKSIKKDQPESYVENPKLTQYPKRHEYLPALWGIDKVVDYIQQWSDPDMQRSSIHRVLVRFTEDGYFSFYRISGVFRYSREDWLQSLETIAEREELRSPGYGRPMQSLYTMLAPFLAVVIQQQRIDPTPLKNYFEALKWRQIFSRQRRRDKTELESMKEQAATVYDEKSPLIYLAPEDKHIEKKLQELQEELFQTV